MRKAVWTIGGILGALIVIGALGNPAPPATKSAASQSTDPAAVAAYKQAQAAFGAIDTVISGTGRAGQLDANALHAEFLALMMRGCSADDAYTVITTLIRNPYLATVEIKRAARVFPAFAVATGWNATWAVSRLSDALSGKIHSFEDIETRISLVGSVELYTLLRDLQSGRQEKANDTILSALSKRFPDR